MKKNQEKSILCAFFSSAFLLTLGLTSCQHQDVITNKLEDTLEEMLQFGLENLGKAEQLEVFYKDGKLDWDVSNNTPLSVEKHDCEGSVYVAAHNAGKIIDAGGCVRAGKNAEGIYYVDKVNCP